ncbi:MAG: response regulator [Treponema sp.]|jgi:signal transduction histidine kinase/CheY-like chemotaxis protein/PAS domain-containing protein/HPt (histidine-containing phosphotransfer) domain-containing protein|nr:response regulator [Treponema sp.]
MSVKHLFSNTKAWVKSSLYAQMLFVALAFALMVIASYSFVSDIERNHLRKSIKDAISYTEANIKADMLEPETILAGISQTIRNMILTGIDAETINRYIQSINDYMQGNQEKRLLGINGFYGVFDVYGGLFLSGDVNWQPPDDYDMPNRPFYIAAVEADGDIGVTHPYFNIATDAEMITFARRIFNEANQPLGIVCLNIFIDRVKQHAINTRFAEKGYGFLLNQNMELIAHPDTSLLGVRLRDVKSYIAAYEDELKEKGHIYEVVTTDYRGINSIVFLEKLYNGWYMGVVTPRDEYYQSTRNLAKILTMLGTALAVILIIILARISAEKNKADERMRLMFDAMPLGANIHNKNFDFFDCNNGALNLLGLSSKQEYLEKFYQLSAEYQPDGELSSKKMAEFNDKAFTDGYCRFEWVHRNLNGDPIPCEITLVRVKHNHEFIVAAYMRDLREIKAAMAKMSEADERTQLMFDATPLGANFWNRDGTIIDCNREVIRLFDMPNKQEYLKNFFNLSPEYQPDGKLSHEKGAELVRRAFYEGYYRFEWMHQKLNGDPIPCEITLIRVKYKDGYIVVGYTRDLREHNAMLAEINRENEKSRAMAHWYNSILNAIPLPISVTDTDAKWTFINSTVEKQLGMSLKDALGKPCSNWGANICNTPDCGIVCAKRGLNQTYFSEGDSSYQVDTAILKDLDDKTMGYIEIVQDITNLKLMTKKQADAEAANHILKNILNGIDAEIYVCIPHTGELLFVNDYMKKQNNIEGDCTGKFCYKIFLDEKQEEICDFCPCYKLDKDPHSTIVWELRLPTGRISRNTTKYIEWTDGRIVQIQHSVDVTELITAKEEAIQANKGKSNFLATMSHEIRTPMNAILGITEIQLQDETLLPKTQEALGEIYNSGYLLLGIINDILDLSKIEAGKLELVPVNYDVPSLINDTVHLNVMRYDSKPIEFSLQVDENIPTTLFGDELRIKQILNNLLSNAFKYTDAGKVTLSAVFEAQQGESTGMLIFRVSDTGQGMTEEQLRKLFDEYTRFNTEANRTTVGTGLGMSIARYLAQMMNGEITVESEQGKGSVFTVRLPQRTVAGAGALGKELAENLKQFRLGRAAQMKKAPQILREYMPYGRILIVDDVETNLYVAKGLMAPYGLSVETAGSGLEAIEKIKSGIVYDVIFMDHFMPGMDGIETTKNIRALGYTQSIVALTANALAGQAEVFMANGFDDFISKPIDIRQMNATLNKLVRDKYPAETIEAARRLKDSLNKSSVNGNSAAASQTSANPELAKVFTRDAEKAAAVLEALQKKEGNYNDEDIQAYIINVHAMKSALANIGETALSGDAMKLEQAGRVRDITVMTGETPAFLNSLRTLIVKIKPKENESGATADADKDRPYLLEKLALLQKACAEYDKKAAKAAVAELRQKTWPRPVNELLDAVAEHLLHSEFTEVAGLVDVYTKDKDS